MIRSMLQVYVRGSIEAVAMYQRAFGAVLKEKYLSEDGSGYMHSELEVFGQILAVSEATADAPLATGDTMQFCLHFGPDEVDTVREIYRVLKEGATVLFPLGPCDYSENMTDLIDRYGVRWCIFAC